jgi:hypothetical protein
MMVCEPGKNKGYVKIDLSDFQTRNKSIGQELEAISRSCGLSDVGQGKLQTFMIRSKIVPV